MDAWLARIEPRVLSEWMAFERIEPFGWPVIRVLIDWGRSVIALLCSASSGTTIDRDKTPDVTVAADAVAQSQTGQAEDDEEPVRSHVADFSVTEATSADILQALKEQNAFRF